MPTPALTFFNHKSGVGKTSLVYHLAWMLAEMGRRVLVADLDPQADLTAAFLAEDDLAALWEAPGPDAAGTIRQCIEPLAAAGDLRAPALLRIDDGLHLLPGDLALSRFEHPLAEQWPKCLGTSALRRPFRMVTALRTVIDAGARACGADVVLIDVGPNLGAINRSALIATDFVVVPLGADLSSRLALRNLGPTLGEWRTEWRKRRAHWSAPEFDLPCGAMRPIGYLVQQHGVRLTVPLQALDRWVKRMPAAYARHVLADGGNQAQGRTPQDDEHCIATVKHYRSLVGLGREARKPIFHLSPADGAVGSHARAVMDARSDFHELAANILRRIA